MRILIINQYALPPSEVGITRHYSLARHLKEMGHQVCIVTSNVHYLSRKKIRRSGLCETIDGIDFFWIGTWEYTKNSWDRLINIIIFCLKTFANLRRFKQFRPDVVIGSSPNPFAAWVAERIAKYCGVPYLLEIRDLWPQTLIDLKLMRENHPFVWLLKRLEIYLCNKAYNIITVLENAGDYLQQLGIARNKVIWIPNGIDFSITKYSNKIQPRECFKIIYCGSHTTSDNIGIILETANILQKVFNEKSIHFILIGDGPDKLRLQQITANLELKNVTFLNSVPKTKIGDILSDADAFITLVKRSPLYKWGISFNKIYDYLACARPVLFCSDLDDNIIKKSDSGISVPPDNPVAIADAIIRLKNMTPQERERIGTNGYNYVKDNYDYGILANHLNRLLLSSIKIKNNIKF